MSEVSQAGNRVSSGPRLVAALLLHVILVGGGVTWAAIRYQSFRDDRTLPTPRIEPVAVLPLYDDSSVISDEDLRIVLKKLRPQFTGHSPKINHVDHALRMWRPEAVFDDSRFLSGIDMREILLDHRRFAMAWGNKAKPLLVPASVGTIVRVKQGLESSSHRDHTLATMAETGTPLDYPVITERGEVTLESLLHRALHSFSPNQAEYEWSILAFAHYLPELNGWFSSEGQHITFDLLADRLMRERRHRGVCRGNHRVYTLVMLLRIDDQIEILTAKGRHRIEAWLRDVTERLVHSQHVDGYWEGDWPGDELEGRAPAVASSFSSMRLRILVTGHVLEAWAMAPEDLLPSRGVIHRASAWLSETIKAMPPASIRDDYTYLTHAGRALALWRGRFPHECRVE